MAYEMVMPYHLHMPSYFLETFTEYPAIERLCMETASMAVFYTQDAWSYSYFISNYKSSFLLKNYFSCDR